MIREERVGALGQHAAELHGRGGRRSTPSPRLTICVHMSSRRYESSGSAPASLADSSAARRAMSAGQAFGLEARGEQRGRPAHDLAQLRLAQRRHVDLARARIVERLVVLQMRRGSRNAIS